MKELVREDLCLDKCTFDTHKDKIIEKVATNADVLHLWSFCVPDADKSVSHTLLRKVVELYVNIRGFTFSSSCVELYKQATKKTLSKSKALRTELKFISIVIIKFVCANIHIHNYFFLLISVRLHKGVFSSSMRHFPCLGASAVPPYCSTS